MKTRIVLLFSLLVCLTCACSKGISGRVSCDGKGLEGVVVSDGYDCVLTDARGRYTLERKRGVRFISVSTPAGYLPETADKTIPLDYQKVMEGCTHYDFNLVKNPLDDSHHVFIVQADAQMNDSSQFTLYQKILDPHGARALQGACGDGQGEGRQDPRHAHRRSGSPRPQLRAVPRLHGRR